MFRVTQNFSQCTYDIPIMLKNDRIVSPVQSIESSECCMQFIDELFLA